MKRMLSVILLAVLLIGIVPVEGRAAENGETVLYFEDGSYLVIGDAVSKSARASGSVSGSKPYTYYDSNGSAQWKAVLNGSFTYNGSSATCTSSSTDISIYDSTWSIWTNLAGKSGNTATATITMIKKVLGITTQSVPANMTLKCDANGNLS